MVIVTESRVAPGAAVGAMMFTCQPPLFLGPFRKATDPRFDFHVLISSNPFRKDERGSVIFVLVSVFFMTLLSEPTADLAVSPPELAIDDTAILELPEGLLQSPVSVSFLFVKPQASLSQFRKGVAEFVEINLRFDRAFLGNTFDSKEKH
jgi:hypothetical protein